MPAKDVVAIVKVKDDDVLGAVNKAVDLLGGLNDIIGRDDSVLVKPNLMRGLPPPVTTSPKVVEATISVLRNITKNIAIVESDATSIKAQDMFLRTGMLEIAKKHGLRLINLSDVETIEVEVPNGKVLQNVVIPRLVLTSKIVNIPVMKTHWLTHISLGIKNIFGMIPDRDKIKYHLTDFHNYLVDLVSVMKPSFVIIDGTVGMEGQGPIKGSPVKLDLIIAGKSFLSVEAIGAKVMGFEPFEIPHIRYAYERGLGEINLDKIEIVGEPLEKVIRPFKRPVLATPRQLTKEVILLSIKNITEQEQKDYVTFEEMIRETIHREDSPYRAELYEALKELIAEGKVEEVGPNIYRRVIKRRNE